MWSMQSIEFINTAAPRVTIIMFWNRAPVHIPPILFNCCSKCYSFSDKKNKRNTKLRWLKYFIKEFPGQFQELYQVEVDFFWRKVMVSSIIAAKLVESATLNGIVFSWKKDATSFHPDIVISWRKIQKILSLAAKDPPSMLVSVICLSFLSLWSEFSQQRLAMQLWNLHAYNHLSFE